MLVSTSNNNYLQFERIRAVRYKVPSTKYDCTYRTYCTFCTYNTCCAYCTYCTYLPYLLYLPYLPYLPYVPYLSSCMATKIPPARFRNASKHLNINMRAPKTRGDGEQFRATLKTPAARFRNTSQSLKSTLRHFETET